MKQVIDMHFPNEEYKYVFEEGGYGQVVVKVETEGSAATITGFSGIIYYYDAVTDTTSYQIASDTIDTAASTITFNVDPTDLATYGAYRSELVIKDASDQPFVYAKGNVVVKRSILDAGTTATTINVAALRTGSGTLTQDTDTFTVSGLGLSSAPTGVWATIVKPDAGDYNIFATVLLDTITTDGFTFELSASPDNGNYKIYYQYEV